MWVKYICISWSQSDERLSATSLQDEIAARALETPATLVIQPTAIRVGRIKDLIILFVMYYICREDIGII